MCWGLTALSAQIGYVIYRAFEKYVAVKNEINEKVDNVTCWEYIQ